MQIEKNKNLERRQATDHKFGKYEILGKLFNYYMDFGNFDSIFLMDSEGLMIFELSTLPSNKKAISAMFSLIQNSIIRALNAVKANKLNYVKISIKSGIYLLKSIPIKNYDKSFILVTYYHKDKSIGSDNCSIFDQLIGDIKAFFRSFSQTVMKNIVHEDYSSRYLSNITCHEYSEKEQIKSIEKLSKQIKKLFI